MNNNTYLIERFDIEQAQNISRFIEDSDSRNRATANVLAVNIASKLFDSNNHTVDTASGLHNVDFILDKYNIADIYVNGAYIDVRIAFNDNELVVPTSHFSNNTLPVAYLFLKLSVDLERAEVLGFIPAEDIEPDFSEEYIHVDFKQLKSFYDIEPMLRQEDDSDEIPEKQIFDLIDKKYFDEIGLLDKLFKSKQSRIRLIKAYKAQTIFNYISKTSGSISSVPELTEFEATEEIQDISFAETPTEEFSLELESDTETFEIQDDSIDTENYEEISELESFDGIETETLDISDSEELNLEDNNLAEAEELDDIIGIENNNEISDLNIVDSLETESSEESYAPEDAVLEELSIGNLEETVYELPETNETYETDSIDAIDEISEEEAYSTVVTPDYDIKEDVDASLNFDQDEESSLEFIKEESEEIYSAIESENENEVIEDFNAEALNDSEEIVDQANQSNNDESEISALFDTPEEEIAVQPANSKKKNIGILPIAALAIVLIGGVYWGYNKFIGQQSLNSSNMPREIENNAVEQVKTEEEPVIAMPVETVDNTGIVLNTEEGTSEAIPAIEQNLDASILVSNLKVDWEVPSGYASNTSAKRYLLKLGKIIQFNLKTELLLLNKPPISNKIAVEIQYNETSGKFETVGVKTSSGENDVDKLIMNVINNALAMNLNMNTDSFKNLNAHPVLIIKL